MIVPYLRGYGTTRFLSIETVRNGQPSAVAVDIIALMDALKIEKATLAGFDWGARTANIIAALWPERCKAMVSVSGYLIGSQEAGKMPLPPKAELQWWYQFYFATERGRAGYDKYRHDFSKLIWQLASPKWNFDDATFDRSAAAFDNPDHVAIVIHNYRWRLGLAEGEPKYDDLEKRLAESPGHHACPPSPWKAMPMARRIRSLAPTPRSSRANIRTGPSRAASGTICRRRPRTRSPKPSSTSSRKAERPKLANRQESSMAQLEKERAASEGGKVVYTAKTHTIGGRENGASRSSDGRLDVKLSLPGSARIGTNPEQLFAAGWSACFESAIGVAAHKRKITLPADVTIDAEVDLHLADSGYFLGARLNVSLPGIEREIAQSLVEEAEQLCPYSKATRGNIDVAINLV